MRQIFINLRKIDGDFDMRFADIRKRDADWGKILSIDAKRVAGFRILFADYHKKDAD